MRSEAELEWLLSEMELGHPLDDQDHMFRGAIGMLRWVLNSSTPDFDKRLSLTREWIGLFHKQSIQ
jgi:hypothetical protein